MTLHGIADLHMIHDSYGCHAAHVGAMRDVIRECAFAMYRGDWLREFHDYVSGYAPDVDLPNPPKRGVWDVSEVMKSEYFFS